MRESEVLSAVRLVFGQADGFVVWRNNVGYDAITRQRFGLQVGASDILGIGPGGLFFACECKSGAGRTSEEQLRFLQVVHNTGGIACLTRSVEQAEEQIRGIRAGIRRHF